MIVCWCEKMLLAAVDKMFRDKRLFGVENGRVYNVASYCFAWSGRRCGDAMPRPAFGVCFTSQGASQQTLRHERESARPLCILLS